MTPTVDDQPTQVIELGYVGEHRHRDGAVGRPVVYHAARALVEARVKARREARP